MKEPSGDLVSLDFYFSDRPCADGMRDLVLHCMGNGASFSGELMASTFAGARISPFSSIYSNSVSLQHVDNDGLMYWLDDENARLTKVGMWGVLELSKNVPEVISFNGISAAASHHDTNALTIIGEGWHFNTPGYEEEAREEAKRCWASFLTACEALVPDYAAILNEDSLPCHYDLRQGHGHRCFSNFFVSHRHGSRFLDAIEKMFSDAYTHRSDAGLYVATGLFSPSYISLDQVSVRARAREVVEILAK